MKHVWDKDKQAWVPKTEYRRPSPMIIGDSMPELLNHADGKVYDSKSSFRRATQNAGYREVGNDSMNVSRETRGDFNIRNDLKQAIQRVLR